MQGAFFHRILVFPSELLKKSAFMGFDKDAFHKFYSTFFKI
jgi:hypothetical protein